MKNKKNENTKPNNIKNSNNKTNNTKPINKHLIIYFVIIGLALSALVCLVIAMHQTSMKKITISQDDYNKLSKDSDKLVYSIDFAGPDTMTLSGIGGAQTGAGPSYYIIHGFAGYKDESVKVFNSQILLKTKDSSDNNYYLLSTEMINRDDLVSYEESDVSYQHGGIIARVKRSKIPQGTYDIYIHYQNDDHNILINTGSTLEAN